MKSYKIEKDDPQYLTYMFDIYNQECKCHQKLNMKQLK